MTRPAVTRQDRLVALMGRAVAPPAGSAAALAQAQALAETAPGAGGNPLRIWPDRGWGIVIRARAWRWVEGDGGGEWMAADPWTGQLLRPGDAAPPPVSFRRWARGEAPGGRAP